MTDAVNLRALDRDLEDFTQRVAALNTARENYAEGTVARLDAALVELGLAEEELRSCRDELASRSDEISERYGAGDRELRLCRDAFDELPFPVFLLSHAGSIRRVSHRASDLLSKTSGYLSGKPLPAFVDVSARATFRTRLAAVARDGDEATFETALVGSGEAYHVRMTLARVQRAGEDSPVVLAAVSSPASDAAYRGVGLDGGADDEEAVAAADRLEIMSAMTRLLLDERSLREQVAHRRAVRLLARHSADWALIDLVGERKARRVAVAGRDGSDDPHAESTETRPLEDADPEDSSLVTEVLRTGNAALRTKVEDEETLGVTAGGYPVLDVLRAGSLMSVPLRDGETVLGALTLVRREGRTEFDLADLGMMEEIGEHLALALGAERRYQRRADVAEVLQASLLPRTLPVGEGIDVATNYQAATPGTEVGGDFYDAFACGEGWRFVLGDVCGKGEEAAAATAMVRHGVRVVSTWEDDPAEVLRRINEAAMTHGETDRFVTSVVAQVTPYSDGARVRMASAGHPPGVLLRADGTTRFADGGGVPLGILAEARLHAEDISLGPGDMLLFYSDGVTDARADGGDSFGDDGLAESLAGCHGQSAASVLATVDGDIRAHAAESFPDDVALLAVRVRPRS